MPRFVCRWSRVRVAAPLGDLLRDPGPAMRAQQAQQAPLPPGRFFHSTFCAGTSSFSHSAPTSDLVVFGGQQLSSTLGCMDAWLARVSCDADAPDASGAEGDGGEDNDGERGASSSWGEWAVEWQALSKQQRRGGAAAGAEAWPAQRRGHTTFAIGRKLIVFGGAAPYVPGGGGGEGGSGRHAGRLPGEWELCPPVVSVLDQGRRWFEAAAEGEPPRRRRGHSTRLVGGLIVISGGYDEGSAQITDKKGHELLLC